MMYWHTTEQRILEAHYPLGGSGEVQRKLAEAGYQRTSCAITARASLCQIEFRGSSKGRSKGRCWRATPHIDQRIIAVYTGPYRYGSVKRLAEELGYPRWWLKNRAAELGVARPSTRGPAWTEAELQIVRDNHRYGLEVIRRKLDAAGYRRTRGAVALLLKRRLRVSPRPHDRYSGTEVARLLGIGTKTVSQWVRQGVLDAERRGTARTAVQNGDMWWIRHEDLRELILTQPHRIDLRKVTDAEWFIDLVAGAPPDGRQHRRKKPEHRNPIARSAA